ncbi:hypothetical protein [Levilactobacillus spicheri]|uniref:Uncharacterized protein n=2 Tax=Levilactobacillus spicheri TaxID=216463 RepID=A0A0F3RPN1_9LACO|nr:hypothetical protein [Levilactobacillus spicheri]KJW11978.1 hypothetical protein VC81_12235 [Levilactobacillus spicheri]KRL46564.1 hypothetical protein FD37_GL000028 [Levilactobacillus spicheri DSM 15429]GEO65938.1 hypothetical protein LSP04_03570 [Levilactobacillus spicheri]
MNEAHKDQAQRIYYNRMPISDQLNTIAHVIRLCGQDLVFTDYLKHQLIDEHRTIDGDELSRILNDSQYNIIGLTKTPHETYTDVRYILQGTHVFDADLNGRPIKALLRLVISETRRSIVTAYYSDVTRFYD